MMILTLLRLRRFEHAVRWQRGMAFDSHHARSGFSVLMRRGGSAESGPSSTVAIAVEKAAGGVMPQRATNRETGDDMRIIINWNSGVRYIQKAMLLYTL